MKSFSLNRDSSDINDLQLFADHKIHYIYINYNTITMIALDNIQYVLYYQCIANYSKIRYNWCKLQKRYLCGNKKYWQRSGKAYQTLTLIYLPMQLDQELSFSMKKVPSL